MNTHELQQRLTPQAGALSLGRDALSTAFADLLVLHFGAAPLVLSGAELAEAAGGALVVTGRASFVGVPDLPLTARFTIDGAGEVQAELRFRMRDDHPGPAAWRFSTSFPDLPTVLNYDDMREEQWLDALVLYDTWLVLVTRAGEDPTFGVPLAPGRINFVSRLRPQGLLGLFEHMASAESVLTLHGAIRLPLPADVTAGLRPFERPWDRLADDQLPLPAGIYLEAALDLGFEVGKVALGDGRLRIYSPVSRAWLAEHDGFDPIQGYTATLALASAGIEVELGAVIARGARQALFTAHLEGVSVGKLAELVDFTGDGGLLDQLPEALRGPVGALERIELTDLTLDLVAPDGVPTIRSMFVTVGLGDLRWQVWDDHLVVEELRCRFGVLDPLRPSARASMFRSRFTATVLGTLAVEGARLRVSAGNEDGFTVRATTDEPIALALDGLLARLGPGVPTPGALTVNYLDVTVQPGKRYAMDLQLAGAPTPWTLELGEQALTVQDVALHLERGAKGPVTGEFTGMIEFAGALLQVRHRFPGGFVARSVLPPLRLGELLSGLGGAALPGGFDLELPASAVLLRGQPGSLALQVMTEIPGIGVLALEASKASGAWGFAFGVELLAGSKPSSVKGLEVLAALEEQLHLDKFLLVVSSIDQPSFQLPDAAQFNNPQMATKKIALPGAGGVTAGLNVFAEWRLDAKKREHNLLRSLLGLEGALGVAIQVPTTPGKGPRMIVGRSGELQGHPFHYKLGVALDAGSPSLFLTGQVTVNIQRRPQTFELTTQFVPTGAFMAATMKGATAIDCGPFKLSNVALEVGVNWAGIPSLGVAATIACEGIHSSVAVFFDSTNPANSMVAGSISDLSARDVLRAFTGGQATPLDELLATIAIEGTRAFAVPAELAGALDGLALDEVAAAFAAEKVTIPSHTQQLSLVTRTKGSAWHLTDLTRMRHYSLERDDDEIRVEVMPQFYFAAQPTAIGAIQFPQAFYLNAAISFAGFAAAVTIDISPNRGFSVDAELDRLVILDEKLFSIAAADGKGGPRLSISTFLQPDHPVPAFRPPHFHVDGRLTLLGLQQRVYASVSVRGVELELVGNLVPGVRFDLDVRFGKSGVGANGKIEVGVGTIDLGELGKIKLDTKLSVELDLDIDGPARDVTIEPGRTFRKGETLVQHDHARLVFEKNGDLVLRNRDGKRLWHSNTGGKGAGRVVFQGDGNLVVYRQKAALWASKTRRDGMRLTLGADGNLELADRAGAVRWQTRTGGSWAAPAAHIELTSSFEFAGQEVKIAGFRVEAKHDTFTRLPAIVGKAVEKALGDAFKDMTRWADAVKDGLVDGVEDAAKVFSDVYGKSEKEAKALAASVSKGANQAGKAIEKAAKDVGKATEKTAKDVGKATENAAKDVGKATENAAKDVGKAASKTIKKLKFW